MMTGSFFAFLSALFFALHAVFVRRAVVDVENADIGLVLSVPISVLLMLPVVVLSGQLPLLLHIPWQGYLWFSAAGILFFAVGRALIYRCTQLVGANVTSILIRANVLISVVCGITVLDEPISWRMAAGVVLIVSGITLTGVNHRMFRGPDGNLMRIPSRALMLGFACGLSLGTAPIFVKLGLERVAEPLLGILVSYTAATAAVSFSLFSSDNRAALSRLPRKAAGLFILTGLLSMAANLARYAALNLAPASIVQPLVWTYPVILLFLSFLMNRNLEMFNWIVVVGTITVVAGSILLI